MKAYAKLALKYSARQTMIHDQDSSVIHFKQHIQQLVCPHMERNNRILVSFVVQEKF